MKIELFPFQKVACKALRGKIAAASWINKGLGEPQIISFTAPTGSGKTIIMASLIENILCGDGANDEQPNAIFIWLSDSPQLNEQSRLKIETKADRIKMNQCVTIQDDSFDQEMLDDGHIYFLNTQRLGVNSNLTKHSDARTYTIWETLANTVREKRDRLYFVIDEAHRGAQGKDIAKATTIMQKFIKGSPDDGIPPMPIVIGMSATPERFRKLAEGMSATTTHTCEVTSEEVRSSGLLKDLIIINFPKGEVVGDEMAVLQAAAADWKEKWEHWAQYCRREQLHDYVNPVFVVQVQNGTDNHISQTNLNDCLSNIEERVGFRFRAGEVVHTFGQTTAAIKVNGLDVKYVEPSQIADDLNIKVVFFKENLSTGWDCPRAETMMSFRKADEDTHIAQLLGRMIRTPLQRHIQSDDVLNNVHLFVPYFNNDTVNRVVKKLQDSEGSDIPADIISSKIGKSTYEILTTGRPKPKSAESQTSLDDTPTRSVTDQSQNEPNQEESADGLFVDIDSTHTELDKKEHLSPTEPKQEPTLPEPTFDRDEVLKFINGSGLLTYKVKKTKISDYLASLIQLAHLIVQVMLDRNAVEDVHREIVEMIHSYITKLKEDGQYDELAKKVKQFELSSQVYDAFGQAIDNYYVRNLFAITDANLESRFRNAENKLGNDGIGNTYVNTYVDKTNTNEYEYMVDVILFTSDEHCMAQLEEYAKEKFHKLDDIYRRKIADIGSDPISDQYNKIVYNSDPVSRHIFYLPPSIGLTIDADGKEYSDHLFINERTGTVKIKLGSWEEATLNEEQQRDDFVCWFRNQPRKDWALCIPYNYNGEMKPAYPDLIIIRRDGNSYVLDILEPHMEKFNDNLGKAKGFAAYAKKNIRIGRIQLIHMSKNALKQDRPLRLDMSRSDIRDKVLDIKTEEELDHLFKEYGTH